ncbi:MAG: phosphotransferase family protein [Conexibacter sp.]|nr:phosphotransferase family protein [Conexibacter sp.]
MAHDIAADDIVRTHEEAAAAERPPLLVLDPLLAFLDAHDLGDGEPEIRAIGDGHSNATYLFDRGGARFVLRRPPRPPIPPSANDMLREARVLSALEGRARVPRVLAVCDDEAVLGAPFYVMEEVVGHVVTSAMPHVLDTPQERLRTAHELVDALVEIHGVDWRAAGLEGFGKPEGYLERQLRRFLGLWEHNKTREIPEVEVVGTWLKENLPASPAATIVHGDYRLGNVLLAPEPPSKIAAVLDWEMSTIGDPLADLGYFCTLYVERDDPTLGKFELSRVTREEGWPTRAELVARYEERSGRSMTDIRWYQALALWKSIVFMEGNFKRASSGMSDDPFLKAFGDGVTALAERAEALTRGE